MRNAIANLLQIIVQGTECLLSLGSLVGILYVLVKIA